jgi:hypothetical protein
MTECSIYRFVEPTRWATTPATFSFSSLNTIEACPLQWQLIHSAYGDLPQYPVRVVHAADGQRIHGPFIERESLRILNAQLAGNGEALELMPWTEVFHR